MRILVCAKQVPDTTEIKIHPTRNTLIRKGVPSILNPYDEYALEKALQLKDDNDGTTITVLSMGPEQVEEMLRQCLSVGADEAYLVTDRAFSGSDTLATSYIISEAIKKLEEETGKFDLVFCGKQAIDGDTAQVGPEIAKNLDMPQVTCAVDIKKVEDKVHITKECDNATLLIESQIPALVTFTKTDDLRFPSMRNKMKAKKAEIKQFSLADIENIDTARIGLKGSPTRVARTHAKKINKESVKIDFSEDAINNLVNLLEETKAI